MKLRDALSKNNRVFKYKSIKYFAFLYIKEDFWPKGKFTVFCTHYPMPDEIIEISSEAIVKPVIRVHEMPN